jgi:DNA-binding transcriptional LysR family regulator
MRKMVEEMTTFAVVAKAGSFTQAAKQLGKSKTYVSLQVSRLEEALGLQLMFRTTRRLELTQAGHAYVDYCGQLLETIDEAERAINVLKGSMQGLIKLSVPVSFGQVFMTDIIAEFQTLYPDVQVQLELHNAFKDLKLESLDLAIRMSRQLEDDLVAIKIGNLTMHIYGSPSYLSKYHDVLTPDNLNQHTAILHSEVDKHNRWPLQIDNDIRLIPLKWNMSVNHYLFIRDAVVEGKGLARLPSYLTQGDLIKNSLVEVLSDFSLPSDPIYLVYDYQRVLHLKNRVFIDFVKTWFEENSV